MNASIARLIALATAALCLTATALSAEKAAPASQTGSTEAQAPKAKRATYPFRGEVASADSSSIVLAKKDGTRAIRLAADSLIERDGKIVSAGDVKPGDYVRGTLKKNESGVEVLVKATAGMKPEKVEKASKKQSRKDA